MARISQGKHYPPGVKKQLQERVYDLWLEGTPERRIARELDLTYNTVHRWINAQREHVWESMGKDKQEGAISDFVSEQRKAMRLSLDLARDPAVKGAAKAMHVKNFADCSVNVAKARGVLSDKAQTDISVNVLIAQLDEAWTRPLPAEAIPALPPDAVDGVILATELPEPAPVDGETSHTAPQ